ncbi:MAG: radical SAM protein [Candidatus Moranbacteria bacterium]|nr:radical SAM protein [Candidatus Moranbacteria bacterium]
MCVNQQRELRFIVAQKCNYDCTFCHGEGLQTPKEALLKPEDFRFIFNVGKKHFGLKTTTLSGGEPLIRKDIVDIADELYHEEAIITLTTNGYFLEDRIYIGNYIKRVNVSIHSLKKEKYELIVRRRNVFHKVIYGLLKLREKYPDVDIRINSTLVDGINSSERDILDLIRFAERLDASIKYVELFPAAMKGFVPLGNVEEFLKRNGFFSIPSQTRKVTLFNGFMEVNLTKIFCATAEDHNKPGAFCRNNNDLFISPDGRIKPCRNNLKEVDILDSVRSMDEESLVKKIKEAFDLLGKNCIISKDASKH